MENLNDDVGLEDALAAIPVGMIWRLGTYSKGRFWFLLGWPTAKGNFSAVLGKYTAIEAAPNLAVQAALIRMAKREDH